MAWVELYVWDSSDDANTRDRRRIMADSMDEVFEIADAYLDECKAADPHLSYDAHIVCADKPYELLFTRYGDDELWEEWEE